MTRRLLAEEGLFAGVSSGAAAHAAVRWAQRLDEGVVVTVFPDSGAKYLSSRLWWGTLEEAVARLGTQLYF
jgi:cysteine synthase